jgi:hypothetical protein
VKQEHFRKKAHEQSIDFSDNVALVTRAASGMVSPRHRIFARENASVVLADFKKDVVGHALTVGGGCLCPEFGAIMSALG